MIWFSQDIPKNVNIPAFFMQAIPNFVYVMKNDMRPRQTIVITYR